MIPYTDPDAWRIAMDASEVTLSAGLGSGDFDGSFYLSPAGSLAGFTLRLCLPGMPELLWESVSLAGGPEVRGSSRLLLDGRVARADVSGLCARVPVGRAGSSYLKIVLTAAFSPLRLRRPRWRLRPVTLRLFTEIRPAESG
ncbi:hypothetical protein ACFPOI_23235 [Nonomuraea angiospora]|uniref:Uncharacterized protein n=1 Tax=Nonomuraea angiospora TaxID=46172 RepID=A0ABR9ML02_9ACTN|nr:hypothetical protein [Nonomuraea angiospora]MBE1593588.1 hypothetical protein [Nonomuraea angiospora]